MKIKVSRVMLSIAACGYQYRRYSLGGTAVSFLFHGVILAIALGWLTHTTEHQKGMLPPAFELSLGEYQLESAPPEKVEGIRQVMSQPTPQQEIEPERDAIVDKLAVSERGSWTKKIEKTTKKIEKKPAIEVKMAEVDNPSTVLSNSTSAPRNGDSHASRANFTSHAQHAVNARVGWENSIHSHLASYKRYPRAALRYKSTGVSHVKIILSEQGKVIAAELVNSSGTRLLDKEALATIERAAPFPFPPHEMMRDGRIEIIAPIGFYL